MSTLSLYFKTLLQVYSSFFFYFNIACNYSLQPCQPLCKAAPRHVIFSMFNSMKLNCFWNGQLSIPLETLCYIQIKDFSWFTRVSLNPAHYKKLLLLKSYLSKSDGQLIVFTDVPSLYLIVLHDRKQDFFYSTQLTDKAVFQIKCLYNTVHGRRRSQWHPDHFGLWTWVCSRVLEKSTKNQYRFGARALFCSSFHPH